MQASADRIRDNGLLHRSELEVDGQVVFADYRRNGDILAILLVEAPLALRGTGAAGQFMLALMEEIRRLELKMTPVCRYAAVWLARHAEYQDMIIRKGTG